MLRNGNWEKRDEWRVVKTREIATAVTNALLS